MRVLAIGGAGFIGRRAVDALRERGHDVWTLGRSRAEGNHVIADRSRPGGLAEALAGRSFEAIVDLAALSPSRGRRGNSAPHRCGPSIRVRLQRRRLSARQRERRGRGPDPGWAAARRGAGLYVGQALVRGRAREGCGGRIPRRRRQAAGGARRRGPHEPDRRLSGAGTGRRPLLVPAGLADAGIGLAWSRDVGSVCALLCEGKAEGFAYNVGFGGLTLQAFLSECAAALGVRAPSLAEATQEELERAGLSLFDVSPYGPASRRPGGWNVTRARDELGFEPSPLRAALDECVAWFRTVQPGPHGYLRRKDELELAERLSRASGS